MVFFIMLFAVCTIWYYSIQRGRLVVRAAAYIIGLAEGSSPEDANSFASSIDTFSASKRKQEVMSFVHAAYGGSQLALISEARPLGFIG